MIFRRALVALTLLAFVAAVPSYAAKPKAKATHKSVAAHKAKCVATKKHPCAVGGAAPSHM